MRLVAMNRAGSNVLPPPACENCTREMMPIGALRAIGGSEGCTGLQMPSMPADRLGASAGLRTQSKFKAPASACRASTRPRAASRDYDLLHASAAPVRRLPNPESHQNENGQRRAASDHHSITFGRVHCCLPSHRCLVSYCGVEESPISRGRFNSARRN